MSTPFREAMGNAAEKSRRNRRGATMVLMLFLLVVFLAMLAFAVDITRMQLVRSQMQTAVDAGAIAGNMQFKLDPDDVPAAEAKAREFVQFNRVGFNDTVPTSEIQVDVGKWDDATRTFTPGETDANAIRVTGRQINEPFTFAGILGKSAFDVGRTGIAASGNTLDVMMVLDLSGSMGSSGRIEALRVAAPDFVNVIDELSDDDRIGVMGYGARIGDYDPVAEGHSGVHYTLSPASLFPDPSIAHEDWAAILESPLTFNLPQLNSTTLSSGSLLAQKYGGGTPIGAAIRDGSHYLANNARTDVDRILVLMSDGRANKPSDDPDGYALQMAGFAASNDITVHTVSLGGSADVALMTNIASIGGGQHFDATDSSGLGGLAGALTQAFRHLASEIKKDVSLVQ